MMLRKLVEPKGIKVDIIDSIAYGMIQGEKVLEQALHVAK